MCFPARLSTVIRRGLRISHYQIPVRRAQSWMRAGLCLIRRVWTKRLRIVRILGISPHRQKEAQKARAKRRGKTGRIVRKKALPRPKSGNLLAILLKVCDNTKRDKGRGRPRTKAKQTYPPFVHTLSAGQKTFIHRRFWGVALLCGTFPHFPQPLLRLRYIK